MALSRRGMSGGSDGGKINHDEIKVHTGYAWFTGCGKVTGLSQLGRQSGSVEEMFSE